MPVTFNPFTGNLDFVGTGGGGGSISGGGTATQVAFFTAATAIGSDPGLFYLPVSGGGPRLGIGTQTPGTDLEILHSGGSVGQRLVQFTTNAIGPTLLMRKARGIVSAPGQTVQDDELGNFQFQGTDETGAFGPNVAFINAKAAQTFTTTPPAQGTYLRFGTTPVNTTGVLERMRIAEDGSLLVGTTATIAGSRTVITGGALHVLGGNALRLQGAGAGFSSFVDPTHAANLLYTLPATQGPPGTVLTNTDGGGTLDWKTPPAGLPGEDGIDGEPGPPGVTGATGPQGATGNTGATGATGAPGLHGMDGIDGDDGMAFPIPGVQGPIGPTGTTGAQGIQGVQGPGGLPGLDGLDGEEGMPIPGIPGPQGATGATGSTGLQGLQGLQGVPGIPGFDGADGDDGMPMPGVVGPQGPIGPAGPTGPSGPQGSAAPPSASDDGGGGTDEWPSYFGQPTVTGDPFAPYLLLAGRTGATNNPTLSIDSSGIITGSAGSNFNLTLIACAGATKGLVRIQDELRLYTSVATITTPKFASRIALSNSISGGGGSFTVLAVQGTLNQTGSTGTLIPVFDFNLSYNVNVGTSAPIFYTFYNRPQITANIAGVGVNDLGFQHQPQFSAVSPGSSFAVISDQGFVCASSYDSGVVGTISGITRQGFLFNGPAVNGTSVTFALNQGLVIGDQGAGVPCEGIHSDLTAAVGRFLINDVGGAASEFAGKFTRYNNDVTAGNGMASVLGAASSLARATSLGATSVVTVTTAATYRAAIYVFTSVVGTGTGSVTGTLTWTDDSNTAKSAVTSNSASLANATSFASEVVYFRAKATSAVQYAATLTGTAGTSTFDVYAVVERVS